MDAKRAEFDRLWNTDSKAKREQFRNWMRAKLDQIRVPVTEENARGFYMGTVRAPPPKEEEPEFKSTTGFAPRRRGPPRRGPSRGGASRGGSSRGRGPPPRRR